MGRNFAAARGLRYRPRAAEHLVMMFPLWHGTMPALRKTFIERVMRAGVALEYRTRGSPRGVGRSARLVAPMGMARELRPD